MLFYLAIMILVPYGNYVIIAQVIIKEKYINISKKLNEGYINEKKILSMKPYWFDKIMSGEKIYEYRTRFANEELEAYIYVSQPVCAITGILHLGRKEYLQTWRDENCENDELVRRIDAYMERGNKVAMPVLKY